MTDSRMQQSTPVVVHRVSEIGTVFSVCAWRDVEVWAQAAEHMVRHISARNYVVLVPDAEVEAFRSRTPAAFQVLPESRYVAPYRTRLKQAVDQVGVRARYGWYLQQVLKLAYLESLAGEDVVLIWDADTVPLRPLRFVGDQGEILYYRGDEFHAPYFSAISALLGMEKIVPFSFIAQCFALKGEWAREFYAYIEQRHGVQWMDAFLASINLRESSGFSEYETLGTFISHRYPGAWRAIDEPWQRYGRGLIGEVGNLDTALGRFQLRPYAFASFESWDRPYGSHARPMRWLLWAYQAVRRIMAGRR